MSKQMKREMSACDRVKEARAGVQLALTRLRKQAARRDAGGISASAIAAEIRAVRSRRKPRGRPIPPTS